MKVIDLMTLGNGVSTETDLCIVGSGPAGVSIAAEFLGTNVQVLIVEGGGQEQTSDDQALYEVENIGVIRDAPQDRVRNRIIGGSSHTWNGRCASFDDIDFEHRPWIAHSGWPINQSDLEPFLQRARKYLGLGPNVYDDRLWDSLGIPPPRPVFDPAVLRSQFWQYSKDERDPLEPTRFSRTLEKINASNIKLLMHANVTHVNTNENGTKAKSIEVSTLDGRRGEVKAKAIVLACGGLENARLLLVSNRIADQGVGNSNDVVGRFLMDHPGCTLGWFDPRRSAAIQSRFGNYFLDHEAGQGVYFLGLMLSPEIQRKEKLLNCAAFLRQTPSANDSWSALKRLIKVGAEQPRSSKAKDASVMVRGVPALLRNLYRRFVGRRGPILSTDELSLYCLVEQSPDPARRVTLARNADALGMPLLRIDWRIGELERQSVMRLNALIHSELQRAGLLKYRSNSLLNDDNIWRSQFIDVAHPSGTTRMSDSPKQGVVDRNCKVHDVASLYIAGSSVFPTVGHANPTLMIVALAIRLADRLKSSEFATSAVSP